MTVPKRPSTARPALATIALATAAVAQTGPPGNTAALRDNGHTLFSASCAYCHGERGFATALLSRRLGPGKAMLEARTDLTPEYVRHAVRHGVGSMPWYRRAELPDVDLDAIIVYLTAAKPTP